jgi:hypothetical protein
MRSPHSDSLCAWQLFGADIAGISTFNTKSHQKGLRNQIDCLANIGVCVCDAHALISCIV